MRAPPIPLQRGTSELHNETENSPSSNVKRNTPQSDSDTGEFSLYIWIGAGDALGPCLGLALALALGLCPSLGLALGPCLGLALGLALALALGPGLGLAFQRAGEREEPW